jgi:acyl-CoA dehydrogenase
MIIFGQGAMRCHPYVFAEFEAASIPNETERLEKFDKSLMGHLSYTFSNFIRTFVLGLTGGLIVQLPKTKTKRYLQQATRFSSAFALLADVSLFVFGGALKRKENISARLGDILSYLYLLSASLKHFSDEGDNAEDLPIVRYGAIYCLYQIQQRIDEILKNFPNRFLAGFLRFIIFPFGKHFSLPSDRLSLKVAELILAPTPSRDRLAKIVFTTDIPNNMFAIVQNALLKVIAAEPIEKILKNAVSMGTIMGDNIIEQAKDACLQKIISEEQLEMVVSAEAARKEVIKVDDFAPEDLPVREFKKFNQHDEVISHKTD